MGQTISVWNVLWIPVPRPRSAEPKMQPQFLNPCLKVDHLIDPVTKSWNVDLPKVYIHPDDVDIIRGMAISRNGRHDFYGWVLHRVQKIHCQIRVYD